MKNEKASSHSVQDFRAAVAASFEASGAVLLNVIDALAVGPRPRSPVEITDSALFACSHHSLYQALRRAADALGEKIDADDWLLDLRRQRLAWLAAYPPPPLRDDLGAWQLRLLDATNHLKHYSGCGRPAQLGAKFQLSDPQTHPRAHRVESWKLATGGRIEVRCWLDVRQKGWAAQPLTLYQVSEYRADGTRRYRRPLWLLFVAGQPPTAETRSAPAPTPREAAAIYDERFSIEHFIRFGKQELGLVSGQFNGLAAEGREQTWVELVATVFWLLWALRAVVDEQQATWPAWWRRRKLTPGAMRRLAAGLFLGLGWNQPEVKVRGKPPGRAKGAVQKPRERFAVYRVGAQ